MTSHLSDVEVFAAADGSLDAARLAHLAKCAPCRAQVEDAGMLVAQLNETEVPEPPPFYWERLSNTVAQATAAEAPTPASVRGWLMIAATAAMVVVGAWVVQNSVGRARPDVPTMASTNATDATRSGSNGDVSWETMLAADFTAADWVDAAGALDLSLDDLSAAEQATFMRLVRQEMGVLQ